MFCENILELQEKIAQYKDGTLLVLAAENDFNYSDLKPILNRCNVPIAGAIFPGLIARGKQQNTGFLLLHFTVKAEVLMFDTQDLASINFEHNSIKKGVGLIFIDGLADDNQSFLNTVFYEVGQDFRFIGSGSGSLSLVQQPCIFDKDDIYQNKAIVILLDLNVGIGIKHGYERIAGPIVANETVGSKVVELNWESAFTSYAHIVKESGLRDICADNFFDVSKQFPFGIKRKGYEDIIRDPFSVNIDGSINCIDDIPENAAVYIMSGDNSKLIAAAKESCKEALSEVNGSPVNCLLIDCISRVLCLGDAFAKEIDEAAQTINEAHESLEVEGVLAMGEVSTFKDGRLEIFNKTFLTSILYV